jgi:metallo-beta-lactamase family protein
MAIIKNMEGYPNKDVGKFADQITALCEKYDDRK